MGTTKTVDRKTLTRIMAGRYGRKLSPAELAILKNPEQLPPNWFRNVVIEPFYLPFRGIITKSPSAPSPEPDLLEFLVNQLTPCGLNDAAEKQTILAEYQTRQSKSIGSSTRPDLSFEKALPVAIKKYRASLESIMTNALSTERPFYYIPVSRVGVGLRTFLP